MDAGDWIALAAIAVSIGAAAVSVWQAHLAKESAKNARTQADAAVEANNLLREQMHRDDARQQQEAVAAEAAAHREAEKVTIAFTDNGGLGVTIENLGSLAIHQVELLDVRALDDGPWTGWSVNRNVGGRLRQTRRPILDSRDKMVVACWLLNDQGQQEVTQPHRADATVRFQDADGQWWETTANNGPERIDPPA
ncbi:hypothetical protein [Streptomyces alfalfae]